MENISSKRFDKIADQYLTSEVHKMSNTIKLVHEKALNWKIEDICDIACGAGHFGISFKEKNCNITAVDPSEKMLEIAKENANKNNVSVYNTIKSFAENLPLPDKSFDLVISRLAPHHFVNTQKSIDEMYRITKPGGHIVIIDLAGYENEDLNHFNHQLEILHDPTHVKSYSALEWKCFFENSEFTNIEIIENQYESSSGVSVKRWCEIASSGVEAENKIRDMLNNAPTTHLDIMNIKKNDADFLLPIKTILAIGKKNSANN